MTWTSPSCAGSPRTRSRRASSAFRGVSQSNVIGGLEEELQVIVDPEKLAARQLTLSRRAAMCCDARTRTLRRATSGKANAAGSSALLGQFRSPEQVENQLLAVRDGDSRCSSATWPRCKLGFKKPDGLVRRFGESSIAINCLRETGANVLDVMDGLREVNAESQSTTSCKPRGLQLTQVYDETDYINSAVDLVQQNIFIGGALTMVVLMAFLHLGTRTLDRRCR